MTHAFLYVVLFKITKPGNVELIPLKNLVGVLDCKNIFTWKNKILQHKHFLIYGILSSNPCKSVALTSSEKHEILYAK